MLYNSKNQKLCLVCNSNNSISDKIEYCLDCQTKSIGMSACLQAVQKQRKDLESIHQFLYFKSVESPLMQAINVLYATEKIIQESKLFKIEQMNLYGYAHNL